MSNNALATASRKELSVRVIIFAVDNARPWPRRGQAKLAASSIMRTNPNVELVVLRSSPPPCFLIPRRLLVEKIIQTPSHQSRSFDKWCHTERLRSPRFAPEAFLDVDRVVLLDADTLVLGDITQVVDAEQLVVGKPSDRLALNREFYGNVSLDVDGIAAGLPLPEDAATGWFFGGPPVMVKEFLEHWYRVTHRFARTGHTRPDRGALNCLLRTGAYPWKHFDSEDFKEVHQLPRHQLPKTLKAVHFGGQNDGTYGREFDQGGTHCMNKLRAMFAMWQEAFQWTPEMHTMDWLET